MTPTLTLKPSIKQAVNDSVARAGWGEAGDRLRDIIQRNRQGQPRGIYSVCSAHPRVIDAALRQSIMDGSLLLIESTSSQVNHLGGYTGQTPQRFAAGVRSAAKAAAVPPEMFMLGGDHLGPYPWRSESARDAMQKACELVCACVRAGYQKIHLDASMACADDDPNLSDETMAERAARLCRAAEDAYRELPSDSPPLLYVIGTEVPIPGGETQPGEPPAVTTVDRLHHTLDTFRKAFAQRELSAEWDRVIAVVVQPAVEFGEHLIVPYDRTKAKALLTALPERPQLVYEAHSTDYQTRNALKQMVEDHFAILKVGPALTFAYREAIFALSAIEQEQFASERGIRLSEVRKALEAAMLRNPSYWQAYYHGSEEEQRFSRAFSYSDRCRYYWPDPAVQKEVDQLLCNLSARALSLPLISQYLPLEYAAIQNGILPADPQALIQHHVRYVLRDYASACGMLKKP